MGDEVGEQRQREDDVVEEDRSGGSVENSSPKKSANPPSPRLNSRPKKLGFGMPEMPSGPPVKSYQLMRTTRMISPKASVTMAR